MVRWVKATGHSSSDWLTERAATCAEIGLEYRRCLNCSKRLTERTVKAIGHSYGEWEIITEQTCAFEGVKRRICANDETHIEIRSIAKLEHNYHAVIIDEKQHELRCTICNDTDVKAHAWTDNNCPECGYIGGGEGLKFESGGDGSYCVVSKVTNAQSDTIEVPEFYQGVKVTVIASEAFSAFRGSSIIIPNTISYINKGAFSDCRMIELTLPFIGASKDEPSNFGYLFGADSVSENRVVPTSLKKVEIIDGVEYLNDEAFMNCSAITQIILPSTVEVLGSKCFYGCTALEEVVLPSNLKKIGIASFGLCNALESIVIPESVDEIGVYALDGLAPNCTIVFKSKSDWVLFEGDKKRMELDEEILAETNSASIITYNKRFTFKRETVEGV